MALRTEKTSDGLKLRDTKTGKLAGAVSTKGKAAPKTLDSKNLPGAAAAGEKTSSDIEAMYAQYAATPTDNVPHMKSSILSLGKEDDEYYVRNEQVQDLFGVIHSTGDGSWRAHTEVEFDDGLQSDILEIGEFETFDEAKAWMDAILAPRMEEIVSFDSRWKSEGLSGMQKSWVARKQEHDIFWDEGTDIDRFGYRGGSMCGATRETTILADGSDCFIVEVKSLEADKNPFHLRSFNTFDKAYAFATEMTLVIDDVEW